MRRKVPTLSVLLRLLASTHIKLVERARAEYERGDGTTVRRTVRGYVDRPPTGPVVVIGKMRHSSQGGANDMIATVIHELVHVADPEAKESTVQRWERECFKIGELREAVAVRLLDLAVFGEDG